MLVIGGVHVAAHFVGRGPELSLKVQPAACIGGVFDVAGVRHAGGYIAQGALRQGKGGRPKAEMLKDEG